MRAWDALDLALPLALVILLAATLPVPAHVTSASGGAKPVGLSMKGAGNATGNLSESLNRLVLIASLAAGAIVTLAWVRVGISWFSNDPTKKVGAKDRARDAAFGTFILLAAVSGLAWGLAHWVLMGS